MNSEIYVACYGDSLIEGFPFSPKYSWIAIAEGINGINMLNYGLCGDCTDDILYRMRQYPVPEFVHHVIFLGGANDVIQGRSIKSIIPVLDRVYAWSRENNYELCFVLPFISTESVLNRSLIELREKMVERYSDKAFLLDLQPAIGLTPGERYKAYVDGVHPKSVTYEAMGKYAAPFIEEWVKGKNKAEAN